MSREINAVTIQLRKLIKRINKLEKELLTLEKQRYDRKVWKKLQNSNRNTGSTVNSTRLFGSWNGRETEDYHNDGESD